MRTLWLSMLLADVVCASFTGPLYALQAAVIQTGTLLAVWVMK